ncbi:CCA tRNA nucleotidyltransferase [Indiicoccus explosivorum]|uniref:CCA tRNA nucleotidyltransferase n=1 Tax=Indiicoccus explosivorum TaxID=1917864 RepID=UPI001F4DFAAA|nr:CCA tRNA nucleotidyltransferase [Indiicoccus explosivorum]
MKEMESAKEIINELEKAGFEAYIVGGAVRDLLLGKSPSDVDVATDALPGQVKKLFPRTADTGISHGTVLVLAGGAGIEVTTFRTESGYSDSRRPDSVEFITSLTEDLRRRDFTINAMALTKNHEVIDPFEGQLDLDRKVIRAVGDPDERFREDALRMLRAVRFAGQLGFELDGRTADSLRMNARRIQAIAIERIKTELDKLLTGAHAKKGLAFLAASGMPSFLPAGFLFTEVPADYPEKMAAPVTGWAFLLLKQHAEAEAVWPYKFSNKEKKLLRGILSAARKESWDSWVLYSHTAEELEHAAKLSDRRIAVEVAKRTLPIQSKSELAVDGTDLLEWTGAGRGPWLREWLAVIERKVVERELANDKVQIKDWFLDEYNNHRPAGQAPD